MRQSMICLLALLFLNNPSAALDTHQSQPCSPAQIDRERPPRTDEEVLPTLRFCDPGLQETMRGLYRTHRRMGKDVLTALRDTLEAYAQEFRDLQTPTPKN